jgi:hypothetical protein
MKTDTAFRALAAGRADRARAKNNFLVKRVNKDGSVSQMRFTDADWRFNAFVDQADAEKRARDLEALNPGKRFVVVSA